MIVAISYYDGDLPAMRKWSEYVKQLGMYASHKLLLLPVRGASRAGIEDVLKQCFGSIVVVECNHHERGWPVSCNRAFEQAAWHCYLTEKKPFLWMEPDAVPLKASWIDDIEAAYNSCGKPFMGDFVGAENAIAGGINHMSGVAVYPYNSPEQASSLFNNDKAAWDIVSANEVLQKFAQTNLIHHDWVANGQWRRENVTRECVRQNAVIYHPDKHGVLMGAISGGGTRAGGELRTGLGSTSFEQPPSDHINEEKPQVQYQEAAQIPEEAVLLEWFDHSLAYAQSNRNYKTKVKKLLIQHGWIKKAKGSKQLGKKVRSSVDKHRGAAPFNGV